MRLHSVGRIVNIQNSTIKVAQVNANLILIAEAKEHAIPETAGEQISAYFPHHGSVKLTNPKTKEELAPANQIATAKATECAQLTRSVGEPSTTVPENI